jgi:hypothetical protein
MTAKKLITDGLRMMAICLAVFICIGLGLIVIVLVELLALAGKVFMLPTRLLGRLAR